MRTSEEHAAFMQGEIDALTEICKTLLLRSVTSPHVTALLHKKEQTLRESVFLTHYDQGRLAVLQKALALTPSQEETT